MKANLNDDDPGLELLLKLADIPREVGEELMKKYPDMKIEIGSHTDSRGNEKYNADLSQKRANSTREFIIQSGIDSKRVVAKGYGESVPIIKCKTDESCSEEEHELNRRSEFVIKNL